MKLEILAKMLQDAGLGVIGESILAHRMPAEVVRGILLRLPIAGVPVHVELPDYYTTSIQIIVRNPVQEEGDLLARQVTGLMTMYRRTFTDDHGNFLMEIKQMFPEKLPIVYPLSIGGNIEWSLNFQVCYVMQGVN